MSFDGASTCNASSATVFFARASPCDASSPTNREFYNSTEWEQLLTQIGNQKIKIDELENKSCIKQRWRIIEITADIVTLEAG